MIKTPLMAALAVALATSFAPSAHAGEVYTGIGTHGLMLGYAQALSPAFTVRGDFASAGTYKMNETEEGYDTVGKLSYHRVGLFGDWFPFGNGFRITGGVTFNNMKGEVNAQGNGTQMTVGDATFISDSSDRINVQITFPKTTPYLGIGWGHQLSSGWGFVFDIGASIGKAKMTETHSGTHLGDPNIVTQEDIDAELADIRADVEKIKAIPMIAIGFNYRF